MSVEKLPIDSKAGAEAPSLLVYPMPFYDSIKWKARLALAYDPLVKRPPIYTTLTGGVGSEILRRPAVDLTREVVKVMGVLTSHPYLWRIPTQLPEDPGLQAAMDLPLKLVISLMNLTKGHQPPMEPKRFSEDARFAAPLTTLAEGQFNDDPLTLCLDRGLNGGGLADPQANAFCNALSEVLVICNWQKVLTSGYYNVVSTSEKGAGTRSELDVQLQVLKRFAAHYLWVSTRAYTSVLEHLARYVQLPQFALTVNYQFEAHAIEQLKTWTDELWGSKARAGGHAPWLTSWEALAAYAVRPSPWGVGVGSIGLTRTFLGYDISEGNRLDAETDVIFLTEHAVKKRIDPLTLWPQVYERVRELASMCAWLETIEEWAQISKLMSVPAVPAAPVPLVDKTTQVIHAEPYGTHVNVSDDLAMLTQLTIPAGYMDGGAVVRYVATQRHQITLLIGPREIGTKIVRPTSVAVRRHMYQLSVARQLASFQPRHLRPHDDQAGESNVESLPNTIDAIAAYLHESVDATILRIMGDKASWAHIMDVSGEAPRPKRGVEWLFTSRFTRDHEVVLVLIPRMRPDYLICFVRASADHALPIVVETRLTAASPMGIVSNDKWLGNAIKEATFGQGNAP